jgi:hypothetical protein
MMPKDRRRKRDLHALNEHGLVLCNPRDKEAAHHAEMEGIATENRSAVTCRKCPERLYKVSKAQGEKGDAQGPYLIGRDRRHAPPPFCATILRWRGRTPTVR